MGPGGGEGPPHWLFCLLYWVEGGGLWMLGIMAPGTWGAGKEGSGSSGTLSPSPGVGQSPVCPSTFSSCQGCWSPCPRGGHGCGHGGLKTEGGACGWHTRLLPAPRSLLTCSQGDPLARKVLNPISCLPDPSSSLQDPGSRSPLQLQGPVPDLAEPGGDRRQQNNCGGLWTWPVTGPALQTRPPFAFLL